MWISVPVRDAAARPGPPLVGPALFVAARAALVVVGRWRGAPAGPAPERAARAVDVGARVTLVPTQQRGQTEQQWLTG